MVSSCRLERVFASSAQPLEPTSLPAGPSGEQTGAFLGGSTSLPEEQGGQVADVEAQVPRGSHAPCLGWS